MDEYLDLLLQDPKLLDAQLQASKALSESPLLAIEDHQVLAYLRDGVLSLLQEVDPCIKSVEICLVVLDVRQDLLLNLKGCVI